MKSNFHEKKAAKEQRFRELADKNQKDSEQLFEKSSKMASGIPLGQPILTGHHSETGDRRYREKIRNTMDKSVEAGKKASYYEGRLHASESNRAISSDDPDAIEKLQQQLAGLETQQQFMKDCNKIIKNKKLTDVEKVAKLRELEPKISEAKYFKLLEPDFCGRTGFADYQLTNNGSNMRRIKKRIEQLQALEKMDTTETTINGIRVVFSVEDNRVQIYFPEKPSSEYIDLLSSNGFHWAPSVDGKPWMRHLSDYAWRLAQRLVTGMVNNPDVTDAP
jgi:hypothetical protein